MERPLALVLSGGVALAAYHAGVYAALTGAGAEPGWVAGSSVGAVTGALLAGTSKEKRLAALQSFWRADFGTDSRSGGWRHLQNWASAFEARLLGVPGHLRPRLTLPGERFRSLYDLTPMRARLKELLDFERLNSGDIRLSVAATDIESGELVVFDTAKGH